MDRILTEVDRLPTSLEQGTGRLPALSTVHPILLTGVALGLATLLRLALTPIFGRPEDRRAETVRSASPGAGQ